MDRKFGHYEIVLTAGPKFPNVTMDVEYFDDHSQVLGNYGCSMIAFATTWKDVAEEIRTGLKMLGLDQDPVSNVSPMVDLS